MNRYMKGIRRGQTIRQIVWLQVATTVHGHLTLFWFYTSVLQAFQLLGNPQKLVRGTHLLDYTSIILKTYVNNSTMFSNILL